MTHKRKLSHLRWLWIPLASGMAGCSTPPQKQPRKHSAPVPVTQSNSCPTTSKQREKEWRQAVEIKRRLVSKILHSNPKLKGVKFDIRAFVDLKCKILDFPGAFVNIAGDYVPRNDSKQRFIVDSVVKKYSDKQIQIYNNIGNYRSWKQ